jgi:Lrp/AsnC family transcriptional regulator
MLAIDEVDRKLLRLMQRYPDRPVIELAENTSMSHTACWRRIKRLESDGIIERRVVVRDLAALGFTVNVMANVRLKQHDETTLEAFESAVQKHAEVVACFSMTGDSDYLLRVIARSIEDYERFLKKILLHFPGVAAVSSNVALKKVKLTTEVPT